MTAPGNQTGTPCELLEWDSQHFGFPIARVLGSSLDCDAAGRVDEWCRANQVRCIYLLADAKDADTSRVAAESGFREVDGRLVIRTALQGLAEPHLGGLAGMEVREAAEADLGQLREIASVSHRGSRFFFDTGFPDARCAALYEAWIDRGFVDPDRTLWVATLDGVPAGYHVIGPAAPDGIRRLELLAVDPNRHGRGIGTALILSTMGALRGEGAEETWTILSPRNLPSIRLHERVGFLTERVQVWHHKWYDGG